MFNAPKQSSWIIIDPIGEIRENLKKQGYTIEMFALCHPRQIGSFSIVDLPIEVVKKYLEKVRSSYEVCNI